MFHRPRKAKRLSLYPILLFCLSIPLLLRLDDFFELGISGGILGISNKYTSPSFNDDGLPHQSVVSSEVESVRRNAQSEINTIAQPENAQGGPKELQAESGTDFYDFEKRNVVFPKPLKLGDNELKVLLTLCTTVKDNIHFIVEWIEYMRIQGVDRLVIADDGSTDKLGLLTKFYKQVDPSFDLRVFPRLQSGIEYGGQPRNLQHCVDTFRNLSEWILVSDTDEFLYSPSHGTLRKMLEELPALERKHGTLVDSIYAQCYRFGSGGQRRRFQYRLEEAPDGTAAYRGCWAEGRRPELMLRQTRRGPFDSSYQAGAAEEARLGERLKGSPPCREAEQRNGGMTCDHGPGKTLFRPAYINKVPCRPLPIASPPNAVPWSHFFLPLKEPGWPVPVILSGSLSALRLSLSLPFRSRSFPHSKSHRHGPGPHRFPPATPPSSARAQRRAALPVARDGPTGGVGSAVGAATIRAQRPRSRRRRGGATEGGRGPRWRSTTRRRSTTAGRPWTTTPTRGTSTSRPGPACPRSPGAPSPPTPSRPCPARPQDPPACAARAGGRPVRARGRGRRARQALPALHRGPGAIRRCQGSSSLPPCLSSHRLSSHRRAQTRARKHARTHARTHARMHAHWHTRARARARTFTPQVRSPRVQVGGGRGAAGHGAVAAGAGRPGGLGTGEQAVRGRGERRPRCRAVGFGCAN